MVCMVCVWALWQLQFTTWNIRKRISLLFTYFLLFFFFCWYFNTTIISGEFGACVRVQTHNRANSERTHSFFLSFFLFLVCALFSIRIFSFVFFCLNLMYFLLAWNCDLIMELVCNFWEFVYILCILKRNEATKSSKRTIKVKKSSLNN